MATSACLNGRLDRAAPRPAAGYPAWAATSWTPPAALPERVPARPDVRAALGRHDFGQLFFLTRKWAGISYSKIAESTGVKPERVGSLARGRGSVTTYEKITQIADGLRVPGHLLGLTPRPWEGGVEPARPAPGGRRWLTWDRPPRQPT